MKLNRRKFLRNTAGLFVPVVFGIYVPSAEARRRALVSPTIPPAAGGGGEGPDVWYYAGSGKSESSFTAGQTASGWAPQTYNYGAVVAVGAAGTCTTISIKAGVDGATARTLKIGLFNASNNLVADGSLSVPASSPAWRDVAVSAAVSAANYTIMGSFETSDGAYAYDSGQDGVYDEFDYASFPPATCSPTTESGTIYGVRMYVD